MPLASWRLMSLARRSVFFFDIDIGARSSLADCTKLPPLGFVKMAVLLVDLVLAQVLVDAAG